MRLIHVTLCGKMRSIDLNCDLGEGCDNDAELMRLISSANIACGFHAGDDDTMRRTVELAIENNVAIGAHPGYRDKENFGRKEMTLDRVMIKRLIVDQVEKLGSICDRLGVKLAHLKPHGALYNQAAEDPALAGAIAEAVVSIDSDLIFYGLSGSVMIDEAERAGLKTASEVFADRTYQTDGTLTPRVLPNALIADENVALAQVMDMVKYGRVRSVDSIMVAIKAETICLHGDGERAVDFARLISERLESHSICIQKPG